MMELKPAGLSHRNGTTDRGQANGALGDHSPIRVKNTDRNLFQRYIQTNIMLRSLSPADIHSEVHPTGPHTPQESGGRNGARLHPLCLIGARGLSE